MIPLDITIRHLAYVLLAVTAFPACDAADPSDGEADPSGSIQMTELTVVFDDDAADHYNNWGGHQPRIVRTSGGDAFTAYVLETGGALQAHVAQRTGAGWTVVHTAPAGHEPPLLLRGPEDRLHLVVPREPEVAEGESPQIGMIDLWSTGQGDQAFNHQPVPGSWHPGEPLYLGAGINAEGQLHVVASYGGHALGGHFELNHLDTETGMWSGFREHGIDYRYAYAYVLPGSSREVYVVAVRDVLQEVLGYEIPDPGVYVFDAVRAWHSDDAATGGFTNILVHEEPRTEAHPDPATFHNFQGDVYLDTRGRLHVIYAAEGTTTGGMQHVRHAVVENDAVVHDALLPEGAEGAGAAITEDTEGRLYVIHYRMDDDHAELMVYPERDDVSLSWDAPTRISLQGHVVRYAGLTLAAPRSGTAPADLVDGGFPSGENGERWVHFRIQLRDDGP